MSSKLLGSWTSDSLTRFQGMQIRLESRVEYDVHGAQRVAKFTAEPRSSMHDTGSDPEEVGQHRSPLV